MKYIFSILRRFSFVKTVLFTFCRFDISCKNIFNLSNNLVILPGKHALSMCILRSLWFLSPAFLPSQRREIKCQDIKLATSMVLWKDQEHFFKKNFFKKIIIKQ